RMAREDSRAQPEAIGGNRRVERGAARTYLAAEAIQRDMADGDELGRGHAVHCSRRAKGRGPAPREIRLRNPGLTITNGRTILTAWERANRPARRSWYTRSAWPRRSGSRASPSVGSPTTSSSRRAD